MAKMEGEESRGEKKQSNSAPRISLPKGGGAIRGIGEKFAANPVTGTGSMSVPIVTSPGRSGFGPQLSLSYDSGAGNGPFGFGWNLSLPSITRKTDKGLPQYKDAVISTASTGSAGSLESAEVESEESDVFILSGVEDLVPVMIEDNGQLKPDIIPRRTVNGIDYRIRRYRPRIEGLFARIEQWTRLSDGDTHWRSITGGNITSIYGKTEESRISDPGDPAHLRVFSWLISESYDDKGNVIVYQYEAENDSNIDHTQANERHRVRTANRYLKYIWYGNTVSRLIQPKLTEAPPLENQWMFEVVFDYDEGHCEDIDPGSTQPEAGQYRSIRASASPEHTWDARPDPFSSHRAGFEVRTYRRCHRVLMFHRFVELGSEPCLIRSTEFDYADLPNMQSAAIEAEMAHPGSTRFASFIRSVTQSGFVRDDSQPVLERNGIKGVIKYVTYIRKSLPALEFEYSKASIQNDIRDPDADSLENLPIGLDGTTYQWVDLDGEGVSGILAGQGDAWVYKPNLGNGSFGPQEIVAALPSLASLSSGRQQLLDLAGDGQLDLAVFSGPAPGFYERTQDRDWEPFRAFRHLPNIPWDEANLRFVDLNGDGHADILITEHEVFTFYPSLAEEGFGPALRTFQPLDEEQGPRLVLADASQSIYLADMCGDGLTDLVRIRNGEVCYWPNLGYGRFGARITMDNAPWFDYPDRFNQKAIRLADIDGSGTNDIIYLGSDGVRLYFNQSGNRWSDPHTLGQFPPVDNLSSVMTADLLGNGTACLVWSSPLPGEARRPLRYIDLMGGQKPHLLVRSVNNLGAETSVDYTSSTKFYLADKREGNPWITKIPFPVHVVERVETYDRISGNRFVTRYAYHHGYFDGIEREFRGFGMVEQWDTEEFAALNVNRKFPAGTNVEEASHVPPVLTRTWFHTGAYPDRGHISDFFAGLLNEKDTREYYREPGLSYTQAQQLLLDDTPLPGGLTAEEEREACRALKGSMLRQEVYGLDGTEKEKYPYTVTEQNFSIRLLQPKAGNRHAVFLTHARESIGCHYERNPEDPRITQSLTLEVDEFGNVLKSAAVGYGRREPDPDLESCDQAKQSELLITYTENEVTNCVDEDDDYRTPLPCESLTYELTGYTPSGVTGRFRISDFVQETPEETPDSRPVHIFDSEIGYEEDPGIGRQRRLIEHVRTLYRCNDLGGPLPPGDLESLALPFESYKLAFTPGILAQVYGGRVTDAMLESEGRYVHSEGDANWWIPSGKVFYSPDPLDTPSQEIAYAREHFFLPHRYRDPFHTDPVSTETFVTYDAYDLLMQETRDALGSRVTVGERLPDGDIDPARPGNDYRVLQPFRVMDQNRNRTQAAFDALGMVAGTAVMGKPEENLGDSLDGFVPDLTGSVILDHLADPLTDPHAILGRATTRLIYDLFAYFRTKDQTDPQGQPCPQPAVVYTMVRETHDADLSPGEQTKIQHSYSYSDGFGREIQKKIQAEPGPVPRRDSQGKNITGPDGQPEMTVNDVSPRWVGSGWTIFNNKGKPVRQYEPFFTDTHCFEFDVQVGVSPVLFYDPAERVVATLHPNHTYEKVVFDPWGQKTYDVNDTIAAHDTQTGDPRTDPDIRGYVAAYFDTQPATWQTWYAQRQGDALGVQEKTAASKAAAHADTPTTAYFDTLGRPFLTLAHNGFKPDGTPDQYAARVELDIEGNQRAVRDAIVQNGDVLGRIVMRYDYDMLGNRIHQASMEAGERWMLNDVTGKPVRAWDNRNHQFRTTYDQLRRPAESWLAEGAEPGLPPEPLTELLVGRTVYGETMPNPEAANLRGKVVQLFDQAGVVTTSEYDFKGNLLSSRRQLAREYKETLNWSVAVPLEAWPDVIPMESQIYTSRTRYDALNRPIRLTAPHSDQPGTKVNVIQPGYNEANLLEKVNVWLNQEAEPVDLLDPATANLKAVTDIDYDAKGQRTLIEYGNGATTFYEYDPLTFRLVHLLTRRNAIDFPGDCPVPPTDEWPGCSVQNLYYTYDPAGNITHIRDDAQQTIFFNNRRVEPSAEYTYDALYRLIEARGREHLGQILGQPNPPTPPDAFNGFHTRLDHPGDGNAMGTYIERYVYDAVGNILTMQHHGSDPVHPGWMRTYDYDETSLVEPGKKSNRLSSTTIGDVTEIYRYDGSAGLHGNITSMPHLPLMQWDYRDQLQATSKQVVNNGGTPETTWYVYDPDGQRVRKVTEYQAAAGQTPKRKEERIYLGGGFEIYRKYAGDDDTVELERETLHIMDDKQRIALVEMRTINTAGTDRAPEQLIRYQFGNHLGSACLELDSEAQIISYEEYYPYGSTSYQASQTETPKRYRYTGKERDEESGLYYHEARYYAAWLGRWGSCDPAGLVDGPNVYRYSRNCPIVLYDPSGTNPPPAQSTNDIVYSISEIQRPGDVAAFWANQVRPNRTNWTHPLSELEQGYIQAFRDSSTPDAIRMRTPVDPTNLTSEEQAAAERLFGSGADAVNQYANYENRRRIMAHYVYSHPATVRLELGLYRLFRDINPIHFALERGWQIGGGREMFTRQEVSRLGAAFEFTAALAIVYGLGRALSSVRPRPEFEAPSGPQRPLTDPIYDLPAEGGGVRINGRWYSEHALERMAPDTPQVRAELASRVRARLERLGIPPGHPAYDRVMTRAMLKIDPRGVPPSVVEAEIANPGSTNVRVITARGGQVVVTVIRR